MAYPVINGPYGLVPVNLMGGIPFAGSTRMIPIAQNYATNIFNGDVIGLSGGNAVITPYNANSTSAAAAGQIVGVMLGAQYPGTPPIFGNLQGQYYPASTNQPGMIAYVMDNPTALFKACVLAQAQNASANQQANTSTTVGYMSPTFVGTNAFLVAGNTGSTTTGNSAMGVSGANPTAGNTAGNIRQTVGTGAAGTAPCLRVVQLVQETAVTVATTLSAASSNSTTLTVTSSAGVQPGMAVTIGGTVFSGASTAPFPTLSNLVVTGVNGTSVTVSSAVTASSGASVSFVGFPEVIVGWNFGYHSYLLAAGV
jgi:hypothetical protein